MKKLSENLIKALHRILKSGTSDSRKTWFHAGDYKKLPNQVSDEADADTCFHQGRAHARGIFLLEAEDFDAHHMNETLEAAEDGLTSGP